MAALNRPTLSNYEVHENVRVDTLDHEDHTFCGVLFPLKIKEDLPVSKILLYSVAVRGRLGPMTVWISNEEEELQQQQRMGGVVQCRFPLQAQSWTKIYEREHAPSFRHYQTLDFSDSPIVLKPGTVRAIYIHSSLPGDEAIVYDNSPHNRNSGGGHWGTRPTFDPNSTRNTHARYEDNFIAIFTGKAHLSTQPFGQFNIWGWDNAWRDYREFVGQIHYGATFQLWQPTLHATRFGSKFNACTQTLFALQRRFESPLSLLPDECLFYILNMCRWDWFDDSSQDLKNKRRQRKAAAKIRKKILHLQQQEFHQQQLRNRQQQAFLDAHQEEEEDMSTQNDETFVSAASRQQQVEGSDEDMADTNENNSLSDDEHNREGQKEGNDVEENFEVRAEEDRDDDDEEEDSDLDDDDDDDEGWDRAHGYHANQSYLSYRYLSSDEEEEQEEEDPVDYNRMNDEDQEDHRSWFRRHFFGIHILQALAQIEAQADERQESVQLHRMHFD